MKRKNRKKFKDNRGLTLVELIVGMFIFSIVTAATLSILMPMIRTMKRANEIAEYNTLFDNIANLIVSDLKKAVNPWPLPLEDEYGNILEDGDGNIIGWRISVNSSPYLIDYANASETNEAGVTRSFILRNGTDLLPRHFSWWTNVSFSLVPPPDGQPMVYLLTVRLSDNNDISLTRDYVIRPLALNQYHGSP
ncbi:MAG: type II secretion system GspH family protein [Lachnospiraceae bacterium]|nr:type II secretion system GspH family protein [Lachnospiraceae bacterium]